MQYNGNVSRDSLPTFLMILRETVINLTVSFTVTVAYDDGIKYIIKRNLVQVLFSN